MTITRPPSDVRMNSVSTRWCGNAHWRDFLFDCTARSYAGGVETRMVSITPTDPGQLPGYSASHLTESPTDTP